MLTQLAASGDDFTNAFHVFLTYPFVDEVVGRDPQVARNLHMGDYTNLSITLDIDVAGGASATPSLPTNLPTVIDPTVIINDVLRAASRAARSRARPARRCWPTLQKLLQLREECAKPENKDKDVCRELNPIPGLPSAAASRSRRRRSRPPPARCRRRSSRPRSSPPGSARAGHGEQPRRRGRGPDGGAS